MNLKGKPLVGNGFRAGKFELERDWKSIGPCRGCRLDCLAMPRVSGRKTHQVNRLGISSD